jgi:DnaJ-domain-containing protein 1
MRIPFWFWIIVGLSLLSWAIPDGVPGEEFILPALAIGGLLLRRMFMKGFYQQQYQQYRHQSSPGSAGTGGASGSQGSARSFYGRFGGWGAGSQGAGYAQPRTATSDKDPHTILGVSKGASIDDIKKAYREKLKKYHPDVVANLRLGDEYKEMFEEKTREIQLAYEQLGGR